jgi:hypothetical protein
MGGALHVFWILSEITYISWSSSVQAVCHWLSVSWLFLNMLLSSFIFSAFSSKNYVLKVLIFLCGMGFNILGGLSIVGVILRASSVLGGMCRVTGEWSEFKLWSLFVVDVYSALLGVFM